MMTRVAISIAACLMMEGSAVSNAYDTANVGVRRAAAPQYILFYGSELPHRIVLKGPGGDGGHFWASIHAPANVRPEALKDRPYISAAVYWTPPLFVRLLADSAPEHLSPANADVVGRFYPAVGDAEPVMVFDGSPYSFRPLTPTRPRSDTTLVQKVHNDGLAILDRVGILTRIVMPSKPND